MSSAGTLWTVEKQWKAKAVSVFSLLHFQFFSLITGPRVIQIRAAAALGGVEIELPTQYEHYVDNKKPEFLSKFPHGKIPAWEGKDGFKLFEGQAIARYGESSYQLANRSLYRHRR